MRVRTVNRTVKTVEKPGETSGQQTDNSGGPVDAWPMSARAESRSVSWGWEMVLTTISMTKQGSLRLSSLLKVKYRYLHYLMHVAVDDWKLTNRGVERRTVEIPNQVVKVSFRGS